ncbi:MAG: hypothetical protein EOM62_20705 [Bacteroidia bacterium]|nr:hypothetical protein [Bacteroidia bacterium]
MEQKPVFITDRLNVRKYTDEQGDLWFVAKDVCEYFGDTNYRRSIARLADGKKGVSHFQTAGGMQKMTVVNEPGLYSLLFKMQPSKARIKNNPRTAERVRMLEEFQDWVCDEVLPSIRKYGMYATPLLIDEILGDTDRIIELAQFGSSR